MRVWMYSRGLVIPFPFPICDPANVQTWWRPRPFCKSSSPPPTFSADCSFHSNRGRIKLLWHIGSFIRNYSKLFKNMCPKSKPNVQTHLWLREFTWSGVKREAGSGYSFQTVLTFFFRRGWWGWYVCPSRFFGNFWFALLWCNRSQLELFLPPFIPSSKIFKNTLLLIDSCLIADPLRDEIQRNKLPGIIVSPR